MYIYQVERDLLEKFIIKYNHYISGRILDVGSGPVKRYARYFKKADRYLTLDINPDDKPDIVGDAEKIPENPDSFDGIVCTQVLGDLLYPEKAIKEFFRVLRPGGIILLSEGFMNELHGEPQDYWRFTPHSLKTLFEKNGFEVLILQKIGGIFCVTAQMFTRYFINRYSLYNRKILGHIFSKIFLTIGKFAVGLDSLLNNKANDRFGLDILIIARKNG